MSQGNDASIHEVMRLAQTIEEYLEQALKEISPESRSIILHLYGPLLPDQPIPFFNHKEIPNEDIREARIEFSLRLESILERERGREEERRKELKKALEFLIDP